ncbi:elongator complex protein 5-like [Styela clava]
MLSEIISGHESSDFTLLTDQVSVQGRDLFYVFMNNFAKKFDVIHVFLFEKLQFEFVDQVFTGTRDKIIIHDFASDPLGWNDLNSPSKVTANFDFVKTIGDSPGSKNVALVIDSFTNLLWHCNVQQITFMFQHFQQNFSKEGGKTSIFGLLHRDLCDSATINCFEYLANNIVDLVTEKEISSISTNDKTSVPKSSNLCKILHKKKHGKVTEFIEIFSIANGLLISSKPWVTEKRIKDVDLSQGGESPISKEDDNIVSSTFNLSLSKDEKEARSKLVMPYIKKTPHLEVKMDDETRGEPALSSETTRGEPASSSETTRGVSASGFIYYEPDDADDFDEEDPDDDLDF